MKKQKESEFSGKFYDLVISPLLKSLRKSVIDMLPDSIDVIEIGCGTGQLAKEMHSKIKSNYLGVDLSESMISRAKSKNIGDQFVFIHEDFLKLKTDKLFDYAIFPMIIHSIPKEIASELILKAKSLARNMIIADYQIPQPKNYKGWLVAFIEKLAGKEHFSSFKEFQKLNGVHYYEEQLNLSEINRIDSDVFQVVRLLSTPLEN